MVFYQNQNGLKIKKFPPNISFQHFYINFHKYYYKYLHPNEVEYMFFTETQVRIIQTRCGKKNVIIIISKLDQNLVLKLVDFISLGNGEWLRVVKLSYCRSLPFVWTYSIPIAESCNNDGLHFDMAFMYICLLIINNLR